MPQAPPTLILIPGLLSSEKEFGLIGHSLKLGGIDLRYLHVEGYCDSTRGGTSTWQEWVVSALRALDAILPVDRPVVLGGLCIGGVVAAELALQRQARVSGLIMMSPTFDYDGWGVPWWYQLRYIAYAMGLDRLIRVAERDPFGIKNERIRRWVQQELQTQRQSAIGPAKLPLWAIHEAEKLMAHVRDHLDRIAQRTLIIHSRLDELSTLQGVEAIYGKIAASAKRMVVLEDSYHMITIDNDRAEVARQLIEFVHGR